VTFKQTSISLVLLLFALPVHATEKPKVDPALCRNRVEYTPDPSVDYKPGVDVDGHYVAPADVANENAAILPKKANNLQQSWRFD